MKRPRRMAGWSAFGVVVVLGALLAFSSLSFAGPLAWPVVLVLGGFVTWVRPPKRTWFGLITGIGVFLLFVGVINLNSNPCPAIGTIASGDPGGAVGCGGLDAKPWLLVGSAASVAGVALYLTAGRRVAGD